MYESIPLVSVTNNGNNKEPTIELKVCFLPNRIKLINKNNIFRIKIIIDGSTNFWVIIEIPLVPPYTMLFLKKNKL